MNQPLDFNSVNHFWPNQKPDIELIRKALLDKIEDVLFYLFPNGKIEGKQFKIGSIKGEQGKSLSIEISGAKIGIWHDFATGDGGDIFDLWREVMGYQKSEFAKLLTEINEWLRYHLVNRKNHQEEFFKKASKGIYFDDLGKATGKWDYLDKNNQLIAVVYRYDTKHGKEFRVRDVKNKKALAPDPRPLYNIPGIINNQRIILVEGEKSAEALNQIGITATTAMCGANAPLDKTDWSVLKDKEVIIWPDNDQAGFDYAKRLSGHLLSIAANLLVLTPPKDKPQKWDAHDATIEGFDVFAFLKTAQEIKSDSNKISRIKPSSWIGTPPVREWLIEGWLPRGYVTALYGDGGVGKSLLAQQLMTCLATGRSWFNHQVIRSRVYGLMCEDDESELWRRQIKINQAFNISMADLDNIRFSSRVGENNFLMSFDGRDIGKPTPFFNELLREIVNFKADLVVLDTAADLFGGNEINRIQVRQFIQNACGNIARAINGAVLLCAHPSDSGIQRKTGTGGSTAWNNTVRSRWYLSYPDEEDANLDQRILSRKKSNYAATGNKIDLIYQDGVFIDNSDDKISERIIGKKHGDKLDAERKRKADVILSLIEQKALQGKLYTINQFAEQFEGKAGLGGKELIRKSLHVYATKSLIRFVQDSLKYNLVQPKKSKLGYICTQETLLKIKDKIDQETGEIIPVTVPVYPSHYKHSESGAILPVEDPKIWINDLGENDYE